MIFFLKIYLNNIFIESNLIRILNTILLTLNNYISGYFSFFCETFKFSKNSLNKMSDYLFIFYTFFCSIHPVNKKYFLLPKNDIKQNFIFEIEYLVYFSIHI